MMMTLPRCRRRVSRSPLSCGNADLYKSKDLINSLREFMENEALSCSMDFEYVVPLCGFWMWGECFSMEARTDR